MSATGRGKVRKKLDAYYTPSYPMHRFLEKATFLQDTGGRWLEPSAGQGAIIEACYSGIESLQKAIHWIAVEMDAANEQVLRNNPFVNEVVIQDFLTYEGKVSTVIGNPPFSKAFEFVKHAHTVAEDYVVFLLRTNFFATEIRAEWLRNNTPDMYVIPNRPSFTQGGTDSCEYAFFVWPVKTPRTEGRLIMLDSTPKGERFASKTDISELTHTSD